MSKEKLRAKKKNYAKDTCTSGACKTDFTKKSTKKESGSFINVILFLILLAGLGWLGYTNGFFNKKEASSVTAVDNLKNETQVKNFVNKNGEMIFSGAKFTVKSTEKENGIWRSILEIDGQLQDFYTTVDGQIILGSETVSNILKSDKEETIADVDADSKSLVIDDTLKEKVQKFIEEKLVQPGTAIEVGEISKEHGLIKVVTKAQGKDQPLYISLDGKRLVFGLISVEDYKKQLDEQAQAQEKAAAVSEENKNDKPVVQYFVMSYCPYGTQFEKGIIPVIKLLGDKIDAQLKFVDYAMHDKKELDENLVQYCIQKEQNAKLYPYLDCFLASQGEEGDSNSCVASTGVNADKLESCVNNADKEFKVSENYKDKATWKGQFPSFGVDKTDNDKYGVGGSPTFVINGQKIATARDSASLLKAICSAFKTPPAECSEKVSSEAPAPGFGTTKTSSNNSGGGCAQ